MDADKTPEKSWRGEPFEAAHSHVGSGCEGSAPASCAPTVPPLLSQGLFFAKIMDVATPLAVSREEILRRNPKVGSILMSNPRRAPSLARRIAHLCEKQGPDETDVANIMGAARKRAKRMAKRRPDAKAAA